jgi:hypothetical protein
MDTGAFNLFIKMVQEDYKLNGGQIEVLSRRLLADEKEFDKVWTLYRNKARSSRGGVDSFKPFLQELLS